MGEIINRNNKLIHQSNSITEASYYLGIQAKRIIWLCLSQVKVGEQAPVKFVVRVSDYAETYGVTIPSASKDFKRGLRDMLTSYVILPDETGEYESVSIPWLQKSTTHEGKGLYGVQFNSEIHPEFSKLSQQYTQLRLWECQSMSSPRVMRLYESLCQWRKAGVFNISPEQLSKRFVLPDSYRTNFAQMKRRFLVPAIEEINRVTSIRVKMDVFKNKDSGKVEIVSFLIASTELIG